MMASVFARKTHKWIALIVGIQATIWLISGAYFTILDIDYIHGDHLIRNIDEPINKDVEILYSFAAVLERYPQATRVDLISRLGRPHYLVTMEPMPVLLDAHSGKIKGPIDKNFAVSLAKYYYAGDGDVAKAALLTDELEKPIEIWGTLPLWQVRFDDAIATTFYISPSSGELILRRHTFWRMSDIMWMLHIMDYEKRLDMNNNLLRVASLSGLLFALSGMWLLVYSLKGRKAAVVDQSSAGGNKSTKNYDLVPKTP